MNDKSPGATKEEIYSFCKDVPKGMSEIAGMPGLTGTGGLYDSKKIYKPRFFIKKDIYYAGKQYNQDTEK